VIGDTVARIGVDGGLAFAPPTLATGSIQVTIEPAGAIAAGAQWQIDGYPLQDSGATLAGLAPGTYPILFKTVPGYVIPADRSVTVVADQTATSTGTYVAIPTGSLQVTIEPPGAIAAGAKWRVDNGAFQDSGTTLSGLSTGSHTVTFIPVIGYTLPPDQDLTINLNQTTTTTGTYVLSTGSLQVTIEPPGAIAAGAQWQIDGGAFQDSGTTLTGLAPVGHTVSFKPVAGYTVPANQEVLIFANQTTTTTGTYVLSTGSLQVTIEPPGAIAAGAKWQVDGGAFQDSGITLSGLSTGSHTVSFKSVNNYVTPANQTITINANQTTSISATYVITIGSLCVTIFPSSVGGTFQIDGKDPFYNSGCYYPLKGIHTISFKSVKNYITPANQTVTITDQPTSISATYNKR
jgi:hypothetical protein